MEKYYENYYKIDDKGSLYVGDVSCKTLAETYGTPLYVFNKRRIIDMCDVYSSSLKKYYGDGQVLYASKAFSCKDIYRTVKSCNIGCDVVSGGELYTALSAGFPAGEICFHGNNKTYEELLFAVKSGVKFVIIDALSEIDELNAICKELNVKQNVLIRVNPGVEAHTHHYIQTAKVDSKFGFSVSDGSAEDAVLKTKECKFLGLKGLHCHIGSQIFDDKAFCLAIEKMTDFYKKLATEKGIIFDVLNLGGGFGIFYSEGDKVLQPKEYENYIKNISETLKKAVAEKNIKKPYLIIEPGRSIVGEAGITLYTVGRIKNIKNVKTYAAIDGGMFENPRFALYQAKYTVVAPEKMLEEKNNKYTIAGKCCESGDIICEDAILPELKEGDLLAVLSTGAYNYSMASNYNRNLIPAVCMVDGETHYIAVKRQTYEDITALDL